MKNIGNKIAAILLTAMGTIVSVMTGDATSLIILLMFSIPMFFAKESWIEF